jgi:Leucine-rich repeat (LRR) protein
MLNVKEINLNHNLLSEIHPEIDRCKYLQFLEVENNYISRTILLTIAHIPESLNNLHMLKKLNISTNYVS